MSGGLGRDTVVLGQGVRQSDERTGAALVGAECQLQGGRATEAAGHRADIHPGPVEH
jgi:hypothetical protein